MSDFKTDDFIDVFSWAKSMENKMTDPTIPLRDYPTETEGLKKEVENQIKMKSEITGRFVNSLCDVGALRLLTANLEEEIQTLRTQNLELQERYNAALDELESTQADLILAHKDIADMTDELLKFVGKEG